MNFMQNLFEFIQMKGGSWNIYLGGGGGASYNVCEPVVNV
jgi:hypothetical protein